MQKNKRHAFLFVLGMLTTTTNILCKTEVYFSPDDRLAIHLGTLLDNAHYKIHAAVYMLTDKMLTEKLINAKRRGVNVQLITDQSCITTPYNKIDLLKQHNVDVFIFPSTTSQNNGLGHSSNLMHNKFAIIDNKVWSGSYNWTRSANYKNQENVMVCDEGKVRLRYEKQFEILKQRCVIPKIKKLVRKQKQMNVHNSFATRLRNRMSYGLQRLRGRR